MKIYTKTGDDGSTGLLGGGGSAARVLKSDFRIECYGTVDELNATVGWAAVAARAGSGGAPHATLQDVANDPRGEVARAGGTAAAATLQDLANDRPDERAGVRAEIALALTDIQNELFVIGSHLAIADGAAPPPSLPPLEESAVSRLEMQIDAATAVLPPLRNFILPGGSELAARLHVARTVCRRAERQLVRFAQDRPVSPTILTYLNRLSDWLFVQARHANHVAGVADVAWNVKG